MAVCIHSHSWLWEIEMIYLHFSSIWNTVKHWCWYPSGNVDGIAFLPTVYLPAASSVGSMHQIQVWHDVTFHLQALESHRYRLCPLPLSLFCLSVFTLCLSLSPSPKAYNLSSGEIVSLSLTIMVQHIFRDLQDEGVLNKKTPYHPVTLASRCKAPNEPSANGLIFFLSVPIELWPG